MLHGLINRLSSPVAPALRSLVAVRVSQLNACGFCVDLNSAMLLKRGVSETKAAAVALWRSSPLFDERERAALAWCEAATLGGDAYDTAFETLRRHFAEDDIVELTALVAFQNMSSKFNSALGVPPQGLCRLPASPPQAAAASWPR